MCSFLWNILRRCCCCCVRYGILCSCCQGICSWCKSNSKIPLVIGDNTLGDVVTSEEYENWIEASQAMRSRKFLDFLDIWVNIYSWIIILVTVGILIVAHIIPVLYLFDPEKYKLWNTCSRSADTENISIACELIMHISTFIPLSIMIAIAIYAILNFNISNIDVYERLLMLSNVSVLAFFLFLSILGILAFVRASLLQNWIVFGEIVFAAFGVLLGLWLQYRIYYYIRAIGGYKVQYPRTERDIVSLVTTAYMNYGQVRVVGSKHSIPNALYVSDALQENQVMISLDYYTGVELDEENMRATVKGGHILGLNRENPLSTFDNGLVNILQEKGWALPDLGGVVMQSVSGFTTMGCAGGSIYHDFFEAVYSLRIIDGMGNIQTFTRPDSIEDDPDYDNEYWGVLVSMGLMGIISEITFNCERSYNVLGTQEQRTPEQWLESGSKIPIDSVDGDGTGLLDLFANPGDEAIQLKRVKKVYESDDIKSDVLIDETTPLKKNRYGSKIASMAEDDSETVFSLYDWYTNPDFEHKTEYNRIFWWPQVFPNIFTIWKAHRERPEIDPGVPQWVDAGIYKNGEFVGRPYSQMAEGITGVIEQVIIGCFYNITNRFITKDNDYQLPCCCTCLVKFIIRCFYPTEYDDANLNPQYFGESWNILLPMDQEIRSKLMPMQFTELWCDIRDTQKIMIALRQFSQREVNPGLQRTGTFSWELYPARAGGFADDTHPGGAWIRPSFGRQSFRIDVLWFDVQDRTPYGFFDQLWTFLVEQGIDFRPHWAKWSPGGNVAYPGAYYDTWADYYESQLPRWQQWHALRTRMDPRNIFLSSYWAYTLGIDAKVAGELYILKKKSE